MRVDTSRFIYKKNSFDSVVRLCFSCSITKMRGQKEQFRYILLFYSYEKFKNVVQAREKFREVYEEDINGVQVVFIPTKIK